MFVEVLRILRVKGDTSPFIYTKHYAILYNASILSRQCVPGTVLDVGYGTTMDG